MAGPFFVDENIAPREATPTLAWADVVLVTGMHIQARADPRHPAPRAFCRQRSRYWAGLPCRPRPKSIRILTISTSAKMGDATDAIIRALDASCARPPQQIVARTKERLPLTEFPIPAYDKVPFGRYLLGTVTIPRRAARICASSAISRGLYGRPAAP